MGVIVKSISGLWPNKNQHTENKKKQINEKKILKTRPRHAVHTNGDLSKATQKAKE